MQPAMLENVEFKTREQATYEALRRAIIQGRWGQGQPLVVSRIATELGVSRITVANALKRLSGEGFVRLTPHKEASVATLEPKEIREIYLMRAELEALSAREAADRIRPDDLDDLHALNREIARLRAEAEPDIRAVRALDLEFHRRMRRIPDLPLLAQTLENLADQCEGYRARLLDLRLVAMPTADRHEPILAALGRHDGALAGERMRAHVLEGMDAVLSMLSPT